MAGPRTATFSGGLRPEVPRTKITAPPASPQYLRRPRLLAMLDASGDDQVMVVSAPSGYGKTLLLADWAARSPDPVAWLALDEDDNDDHRFWEAVLSGAAAGFRGVLADLVVPARPSGDPEFLTSVERALTVLGPAVRLVLDDVHELVAPGPLRGLDALVRYRARGPHLVLAGRTDPPLPVARMRLAGQVCEIRAGSLRFSTAEAADVMAAAAGVSVRPDQVQLLVAQTGGWAVGLRLAALSLREAADPDRLLSDLVGNSAAVSDYLAAEILSRIAPDVRDLLGAVSICEDVHARLAAVLSGRRDAGAVLDAVERDTALVLTSGEGRRRYRVQPLLRAHLQADLRRRRPELLRRLHGTAPAGSTTRASHGRRSRTRGSRGTGGGSRSCCAGTPSG